MSLIKQYFKETKSLMEKYGERSIVFMQVGSFYEVYAYKNKAQNRIYGSAIEEFKTVCDFHVSEKKGIKTDNENVIVLMAGFPEYQIEKYVSVLQDHKYTVAVFKQYKTSTGHTRKLEMICSPGTFFNDSVVQQDLSNFISCIRIYRHQPTAFQSEDYIVVGIASMNIITGDIKFAEYKETFKHNPTTYDFLVRFMSIINPNELIIIYDSSEFSHDFVEDMVNFIECSNVTLHKIDIQNKSTPQSLSAIRCEKQQVQYEILLQCYPSYDIDVLIEECGFRENYIAWNAVTFLIDFIYEHNKKLLEKIKFPEKEFSSNHLHLANHSLKQLNIISDNRYVGKKGCVLDFMNNSITPMGKRQFKDWLLHPLIDVSQIQRRYDMIREVGKWKSSQMKDVKGALMRMSDISRLFRSITMGKYTIQNVSLLYENLVLCLDVFETLGRNTDSIWNTFLSMDTIWKECSEIIERLQQEINLEYGVNSYDAMSDDIEGGLLYNRNVFKRGKYSDMDLYERGWIESVEKVHALRDLFSNIIDELSSKKKKKGSNTSTNSYCKIQSMDKTGYYIKATSSRCEYLKTYFADGKDISIQYESILDNTEKSFQIQMPISYTTVSSSDKRVGNSQIDTYLVNCRENREIFMNKQDALFENKMLMFMNEYNDKISRIIECISTLDVIIGNAELAKERNYVCPQIKSSMENKDTKNKNKDEKNQGEDTKPIAYVHAESMRHPLIEVIQTQEVYIANDIHLGMKGSESTEGILLFGTNAVGKSSLIKAVGMNVILAQAGFFVPCESFVYYPFQKIFTRILGNDNLFKGLSTFAVEMSELNTILRYSDENSLVLGDELCSGTEMGSAISIFVAGLLELEKNRVKYMFATHLHEITDMSLVKRMEHMRLKHLSVHYDRENDMLVYDRKLQDGAGSNLYGLEVCKALHLPSSFLEMANQIRIERYPESKGISKRKTSRYNKGKIKFNCELCHKESDEVHHLQQQKFADKEGFIGSIHKDHQANLINVCHECHDELHKKKKVLKKKKTTKGVKLIEDRLMD